MLAGVGVLSFVVAFLLIRILLARFARFGLDRPNARSMHERPVPRTGGIAVLAGAAISLVFAAGELWLPALLGLLLAIVSFADDLWSLPAPARLAAHVAAAGLLVWHALSPMHAVEMAVLIVAVAWLTNLYNFMDGSDGLAGGMAMIGFGAYALAAHLAQDLAVASLAAGLSAASAAFLLHNHHPARIFLGDVGSIPLGFLAGALGVTGWRNDVWPLWFPVLVFAPFIGDATVTLIKRALRGERVWQAHRQHYYQRMVLMGLGHRGTAFAAYAAMIACAAAALYGRDKGPAEQAVVFLSASALLAAAAVWVDLRWARHRRSPGATA